MISLMYQHIKIPSATCLVEPLSQCQQGHPGLLLVFVCWTLHHNRLHFVYDLCILDIQYTTHYPPQQASHLGSGAHPHVGHAGTKQLCRAC